ncbi:hypothetical protein NB693_21560 [Pantoea ananatis]|uniref:hypothetical protein n=1 Tax=Pantoea ananas TaxID=553 RepID=UPI002220706A|nr:hypothetical protein [Pantoea ananatis]
MTGAVQDVSGPARAARRGSAARPGRPGGFIAPDAFIQLCEHRADPAALVEHEAGLAAS